MAKICFITSIYGNYETTCKSFFPQTVETDFICFTDNHNIDSNGWSIDTTPYHITHPSPLDNHQYINSLKNNLHTFNVAKYYKQAFHNIPRLNKYEVVIWLDGTIEIIYAQTSEYIMAKIQSEKIIGWYNSGRDGLLRNEAEASVPGDRYSSTFYNNQSQPYQDVLQQYQYYLDDGYSETLFKEIPQYSSNSQYGVWITCFVAFLQKDESVLQFLDMWYLQTLRYTTQDQVSFPYVCQKTRIFPYTLPDHEIYGEKTYFKTQFYTKHEHGK